MAVIEITMVHRITFCALLCCLSLGAAHAADIYQWTDDSGRVHLADRPPENHKLQVRKVDSADYELTEAQKKSAQAKAAATQAQSDRVKAGGGAPLPSEASEPASLSKPSPPGQDCEQQMRQYRESEACFAPYKTWNGGTRPEAFERCQEVKAPSGECGYLR